MCFCFNEKNDANCIELKKKLFVFHVLDLKAIMYYIYNKTSLKVDIYILKYDRCSPPHLRYSLVLRFF